MFPVGRLDRDSSGLVLLTDDGRVPEALLDPKNKAPKTYDVEVDRAGSDAAVQKLPGSAPGDAHYVWVGGIAHDENLDVVGGVVVDRVHV